MDEIKHKLEENDQLNQINEITVMEKRHTHIFDVIDQQEYGKKCIHESSCSYHDKISR